jgi:hypothetical protein
MEGDIAAFPQFLYVSYRNTGAQNTLLDNVLAGYSRRLLVRYSQNRVLKKEIPGSKVAIALMRESH